MHSLGTMSKEAAEVGQSSTHKSLEHLGHRVDRPVGERREAQICQMLMQMESNKTLLPTYLAMPLIKSNLCLFYPKAEK